MKFTTTLALAGAATTTTLPVVHGLPHAGKPLGKMLDTPVNRALEKAIDRMKQEQGEGRLLEESAAAYFDNPCNSDLIQYMYDLIIAIGDWELVYDLFLYNAGVILPAYATLLYSEGSSNALFSTQPASFGIGGNYTDLILEKSDQLVDFWAADNPDYEFFTDSQAQNSGRIRIKDMHGSYLAEPNVLYRLCEDFGLAFFCSSWVSDFEAMVERVPGKYDNLLFTVNALTLDTEFAADILGMTLPPTITLGDGIFNFIEQAPVDTAHGVEFVLAHEFVHVLQMDWFKDESSYKFYEYTDNNWRLMEYELGADALAGYYMAHDLGGNYTVTEVDLLGVHVQAFGDPDELDGHGTAGQRECAMDWGAIQAFEVGTAGSTFDDLKSLFNIAYNQILEGDPNVCPDIEGNVTCGDGTDDFYGDSWSGASMICGFNQVVTMGFALALIVSLC
eukprot:Nitzschia sp. Nitz4//scaffold259_size27336//19940//21280//NITZ4_008194-RA/size27336-processed-gene-0.7-mRNA-1//-1//CDS//3329544513//2483//frame0